MPYRRHSARSTRNVTTWGESWPVSDRLSRCTSRTAPHPAVLSHGSPAPPLPTPRRPLSELARMQAARIELPVRGLWIIAELERTRDAVQAAWTAHKAKLDNALSKAEKAARAQAETLPVSAALRDQHVLEVTAEERQAAQVRIRAPRNFGAGVTKTQRRRGRASGRTPGSIRGGTVGLTTGRARRQSSGALPVPHSARPALLSMTANAVAPGSCGTSGGLGVLFWCTGHPTGAHTALDACRACIGDGPDRRRALGIPGDLGTMNTHPAGLI
jgi:hypothetical protein